MRRKMRKVRSSLVYDDDGGGDDGDEERERRRRGILEGSTAAPHLGQGAHFTGWECHAYRSWGAGSWCLRVSSPLLLLPPLPMGLLVMKKEEEESP
jgi:hypothetical protein